MKATSRLAAEILGEEARIEGPAVLRTAVSVAMNHASCDDKENMRLEVAYAVIEAVERYLKEGAELRVWEERQSELRGLAMALGFARTNSEADNAIADEEQG